MLESLELSLAARYDDYSDFGDTTNPKIAVRWEPIESLAFRASWGTGFRAPSLAQIGLGPSQESQFFVDTYGCADNPTYCASTDYKIIFSGNPDLQPEESENFNVGVAWKPIDRLGASVDYWDIKQDDKIDEVPFGFLYTQFCSVQDSTVCIRGAPLAGRYPRGAADRSTPASSTSASRRQRRGPERALQHGPGRRRVDARPRLLADARIPEASSSNADGTRLVERDLTGEYEYPEDRFVLTGDWAHGRLGRATPR